MTQKQGDLVDSKPARRPQRIVLEGRYVSLVPTNAKEHAPALFSASNGEEQDRLWDYMSDGPYADLPSFQDALEKKAASEDPLFFTITDARTSEALGVAAYLRIEPQHRVIEVGHILYTPRLQRTAGATEAMYLMAQYVFEELGYRRYEWKCNSLNEPSRHAALRLGFSFEGLFRQHMIIKGRNRDTAWFSMMDAEWPERKAAFEEWLTPSNFDGEGKQIKPLARMR
jgi:RimJ/RimL family protein N-acetyltransferase